MQWSEQARQRWRGAVAAVEQDLEAWREAHPHATFAEIEAEVSAHMAAARARMLEHLAGAAATAQVSAQPALARPTCPQCGTRLTPRGRHQREVLTEGDQAVVLEREYAVCPTCTVGLFPPR
jgi:hypothetical protein